MANGKSNMALLFGGLALVVLIAIGAVWWISSSSTETIVTSQQAAAATTAVVSGTSEFCANNPSVDLEWRIVNEDASQATYLLGTIYIAELSDDGSVKSLTEATGGNVSTRTDSTEVLKCNAAHAVYIRTDQDGAANTLSEPLMISAEDTEQDPVRLDIKTSGFSVLEARAKDVVDDALVDDDQDNTTTNFEAAGATFFSVTTDTAKNVTADATYEMQLQVQTVDSDAKFGSNTWICVNNADDTNSNDWEEPSVSFKGATLENGLGELSSNDVLALNSYEYCYSLGMPLHENLETISINMATGAGVDPDFDWVVKFVAEGVYEDDKNPGELLSGVGFRSDSARTEMATATEQVYTFSTD